MDLNISRSTLATIIVIVALVACLTGYAAHLNGGSLDFSDTEAKVVVSGSMDGEPRDYEIRTIPTGSLIMIHRVPSDPSDYSLLIGDREV